MVFVATHTWVTGETITAALLNEQLRDNMNAVRSAPLAIVTRTTGQTLNNDTWTAVDFTSEITDAEGWHSNGTNPSRITPNVAGKYRVSGQVEFAANTAGDRSVRIGLNGVGTAQTKRQVTLRPASSGSVPTFLEVNGIVEVNGTTDYIQIGAFQSTGGALDTGTSVGCVFEVIWQGV